MNLNFNRGLREYTKKDKFYTRYVGKQYPGTVGQRQSHEVISMGMEELFTNPIRFLKADPGHFELTINAMRGQFSEAATERAIRLTKAATRLGKSLLRGSVDELSTNLFFTGGI